MTEKSKRIEPRLPRGFEDRLPGDIAAVDEMVGKIRAVYERYGFDPVETPFFEYTETLGKFLPDTDRPNAGVFSLQDDDEQWMSLRYDLTAPLARHFAENFDRLPKPYRSYRQGWVFRNEKPGPGRFRQFMQFDADTVGAAGPEADAEMCMMMADTMDALGLAGKYVVKVNNRKFLDGVLDGIGLAGDENAARRLIVMRALDKLDRLGADGVRQLLGSGRKDDSGDFTPGAELPATAIDQLVDSIVERSGDPRQLRIRIAEALSAAQTGVEALKALLDNIDKNERPNPNALGLDDKQIGILLSIFDPSYLTWYEDTDLFDADDRIVGVEYDDEILELPQTNANILYGLSGASLVSDRAGEGFAELRTMARLFSASGYGTNRIRIDPSVVRGLEYYTGPVFEIELTFPVTNEKGQQVVFGSVGGGGRYDGLVSRFRSEPVPATGFSIGVSRLAHALKLTGNLSASEPVGPVVVLVLDKDQTPRYQSVVSALRKAGIRAEMFMGNTKNFGKQVAYADKRNSPAVIIEGSQEREAGKVQIKDLIAGKEEAKAIADNATYKAERPGQFECDGDLDAIVAAISALPAVKAYLETKR